MMNKRTLTESRIQIKMEKPIQNGIVVLVSFVNASKYWFLLVKNSENLFFLVSDDTYITLRALAGY